MNGIRPGKTTKNRDNDESQPIPVITLNQRQLLSGIDLIRSQPKSGKATPLLFFLLWASGGSFFIIRIGHTTFRRKDVVLGQVKQKAFGLRLFLPISMTGDRGIVTGLKIDAEAGANSEHEGVFRAVGL